MTGEVVIDNCNYCLEETLAEIDRASVQEFPECFKRGRFIRPAHEQLSPERYREYVTFRVNLLNRKKRRCYRFASELDEVTACADCLRRVILELE